MIFSGATTVKFKENKKKIKKKAETSTCLPRNDLVVMEGVHEGLANVQYGHSHVRGLREPHLFLGHVDGRQIFVNNSERLEVRLGGESLELPAVRDELDVLMFSNVFLNDETTSTKKHT